MATKQSTALESRPDGADAIQLSDIEMAAVSAASKPEQDPFLVTFDEPFDAENPR